jgi:hypothetical protein
VTKKTKEQPANGDVLLHCGHLEKSMRWYLFDPPTRVGRPDGSIIKAKWVAICTVCLAKPHADVRELARADGIWQGDEPVINEHVKA